MKTSVVAGGILTVVAIAAVVTVIVTEQQPEEQCGASSVWDHALRRCVAKPSAAVPGDYHVEPGCENKSCSCSQGIECGQNAHCHSDGHAGVDTPTGFYCQCNDPIAEFGSLGYWRPDGGTYFFTQFNPALGNHCECPAGSRAEGLAGSGSDKCVNINECIEDDPCPENFKCVDKTPAGWSYTASDIPTPGYECKCEGDYTLTADGQCRCPAGEVPKTDGSYGCETVNVCSGHHCGPNAMCVPDTTPTGWHCECAAGGWFSAGRTRRGGETSWVGEDDPNNRCECEEGTTENASGSCVDINECATQPDACPTNFKCVNKSPGFDCTCSSPFKLDASGKCSCPAGKAPKTDGSYGCETINACSYSNCGPNAKCVVEGGSRARCECVGGGWFSAGRTRRGGETFWYGEDDPNNRCECEEGSEPNASGSCVDINECVGHSGDGHDHHEESGVDCGANAKCVNKTPGYECVCNWWYSKNSAGQCV